MGDWCAKGELKMSETHDLNCEKALTGMTGLVEQRGANGHKRMSYARIFRRYSADGLQACGTPQVAHERSGASQRALQIRKNARHNARICGCAPMQQAQGLIPVAFYTRAVCGAN